ncbi:MAG TPA: amidohydrolase family protein [Burkholderiaceae bacterium]|nr:amidohydrolase family protein [Burkholderiaceae bacterium]
MHDLVIRGGRVVDGTGAPARTADIAIDGDRISEVGAAVGAGRREIRADGALVTPGFVDIHTHYDGQATWDSLLTPTTWHGVTTTVFGNCGVGFAPVRAPDAGFLINLMEGVEDIPGTVLAEGIDFCWESFPQYLDALAAKPHALDIGAQVPHTALRFYVMGERGADHAQQPTAEELAKMGELLEEALHAGALGLSTSRTTKHRARDGRVTPSLSAGEPELAALAGAMKRAGRGVLEVNSDFGEGDFEKLQAAAALSGRPMSLLLIQVDNDPGLWRRTLDNVHAARRAGLDVTAQVGTRPIGVLLGFEATLHPFARHPAWLEIAGLPPAERIARLRADAALRARLVDERPDDAYTRNQFKMLHRAFVLSDRPDYEPTPEQAIVARAQREGVSPWALALEALMAHDGRGLLLHPFENYNAGNLDVVREMIADPYTVMGVGDGGAHVGTICDASGPTFLLQHWARERSRGERLPLELLVRKQTRDSAMSYGLADRGVLAPGFKADLNVIDFDRLAVRKPEIVYDLPAGGKRFIQRADGYLHTFVSGVETLADDELTGALPGRLLR